MFIEADINQEEVDRPFDGWCCSGHHAPLDFKRGGPEQPLVPVKFFLVKSKNVTGIYCELCLIVAHWMSKQKK